MAIPTLLTGEAEAQALIRSSRPAWLFKHSNACSVSHEAEREVADYLAAHDDPAGMVVVQGQRPLSNWIATTLKCAHQSPQLFLLREGVVLWQASHWGITAAAMAAARARAEARA
jgi:thioredoxin 1